VSDGSEVWETPAGKRFEFPHEHLSVGVTDGMLCLFRFHSPFACFFFILRFLGLTIAP